MSFDSVKPAPPDPILGITEAYREDPNPNKINLSVGVYKDEDGNTPIFAAVKAAEGRRLADESTKSYLPIEGSSDYGDAVRALLFGSQHPVIAERRAVTADTPGGTGALRVAADFLKTVRPGARVWLSTPTWPNHPDIFAAAGLEVKFYRYYDEQQRSLDFAGMTDALQSVDEDDVVLLHGCCHNPTGLDLVQEQWTELAGLVRERKALPLLDFAYQGLAEGLEEDAVGVREFCSGGHEMLVASSFSKNFGLYRERTGALSLVAHSEESARACLTRIKRAIRANYSNPPAHGATIVTTVLNDPELRPVWEKELTGMRKRIAEMRLLFVDTLKSLGVERDFAFLIRQRGMFSYSGLDKEQVQALREKHNVYIVGDGRINVAGMTHANMDSLCRAVADVL